MIVSPTAGLFGGTERVLETLISQCGPESGISIAFLTNGPLVDLTQRAAIPHAIIPRGRFRNPVQTFRAICELRKFIRKTNPSQILSWTDMAHLYAAPASIGLVPCMWWQRTNVNSGLLSFICKWHPSKGAIANSQFTRKQLLARRVRVASMVLYPPYDANRFNAPSPDQAQLRRELGLPANRLIIGSVGRLQKWKGFDTIVNAMALLLRDYPKACCLLIGAKHEREPEFAEVLRQQIVDLGLQDHFYVFGAQRDVSRWMQAMDIFVHAAKNEPFGIVVPEAMALGLPVIASVPGGPAEAIEPDISGLLVQSGDAGQLSEAIIRLVESRSLRDSLGLKARYRALAFSSNGFLERLRSAIESIT